MDIELIKRLSKIEDLLKETRRDVHIQKAQLEQIRHNVNYQIYDEVYQLVTQKQLSFVDTVRKVTKEGLSLARFGDGELGMAVNPVRDIQFQKNSFELSRDLQRILEVEQEGLLVALPHFHYTTSWMSIYARYWPVVKHWIKDKKTTVGKCSRFKTARF